MTSETEPEAAPTKALPPTYEDSVNTIEAVANRLDAKERYVQQQVVHQAYGPGVPPVIVMVPHPQHHTVIHTAGMMTEYGEKSVQTTCYQCLQVVETSTVRELKIDAYKWALVLFMLGGPLFCWIPFLLDYNYKTIHKCPVCDAHLGSYNA